MVSIASLWLPILLSAVVVFVASSVSHMVLKLHQADYQQLPGESAVLASMREADVGPGNYMFPHCSDPTQMESPEMRARFERGPVGFVNVMPSGPPAVGRSLALWFAYSIVVGVFVAYICSRTLPRGTDYLAVFRIAGATAFMSYGVANVVDSIWKAQRWSTTLRHVGDGLLYSLLTAGVFGWLWPA